MTRRIKRRGDDIPPISAYAHWNEDAAYMWWEENKYDMYHSDEIIEDDWDGPDEGPYGQEKEFLLRSSAEKFMSQHNNADLHHYGSKWVVEYWD